MNKNFSSNNLNGITPALKKVSPNNYYEPDELCKYLVNLDLQTGQVTSTTEIDFINAVSDIELHHSIPLEIRNMFEISKALFAYGYLYYQFSTIASEQGLKTLEALITYIYEDSYNPSDKATQKRPRLVDKINYLFKKEIITEEQKNKLDIYREFRNMLFHPKYQQVIGHYVGTLRGIAELINDIYYSFASLKSKN